MRAKIDLLKEKLQHFIKVLHEKHIIKHIDITYQVVWNLFLIFVIFGTMCFLFIGGAGAGFFASLVKDEPLRPQAEMKKDIYNYEEISEIYFADNVYLGEIPYELERREVSLSEISEHLINAIVATEDEYFFEHDGIVPKAILRATFQEFANSSVQTGGSTLTQQLVKNQILTNEVSFERKAREIILAMRLEKFFDKEEILEAYLNVVPFGRNASGRNIAGVQAAAQGIFGVDAKDLTLAQAAYIAGLPQSPFGYTPFTSNGTVKENLTPSINRMKTVLRRMREANYITEQEYNHALNYDIRANLTEKTTSSLSEYPYLTNEAQRRATEILMKMLMERDNINIDELEGEERLSKLTTYRELANRDLRRSGYKIHMTVKKDIYDAMNAAMEDDRYFGPERDGELEEVGAVLIENATGAILGFVGGRDFERQELNHATQAYRSNGSTMKPLLAYAPAIDVGAVQPGHIIPDVPSTYTNSTQEIRNFNRQHRGLITVREALQTSQNVPAVKSFRKAPHEKAREALEKMGFRNLADGEPFEATSIGAITNGVTVEQNVNAYATFANGGKHIPSYLIEKIETKDGEVIYEHQTTAVDVFSPQTAYLMIDMLRDVLRGGTASYLPGRLKFGADWAGKTGTSNDFHDSWFVGTNPNVTLGVWIGYDTPKPIQTRQVAGLTYGQRTQQIWANLANAAYDVQPEIMNPGKNFEMPSGIVRQSICGVSGLLPSELCSEAGLVKSDLFNANFVPTRVDDSLQRVNYVLINNQPYVALETTPSEFTYSGVSIKEEYLESHNLSEYIPSSWNNIVPDRIASENGKQPDMVINVRLNGNELTWGQHPENDIVGYRVYQARNGNSNFQLIASVKGNTTTSHSVPGGASAFYVTAVDVAGKESTQSLVVKGANWNEQPAEAEKEDNPAPPNQKEDEEDNEEKPPTDNGHNNNQGDNNRDRENNSNGNNNGGGTGNNNSGSNNNGSNNGSNNNGNRSS